MKTELDKQFEKDDEWLRFSESTRYIVIPITHIVCQYFLWWSDFSWWLKVILTVPCIFLGIIACGFVGLLLSPFVRLFNIIFGSSAK